jgi:DNA invertase Pin-like site-specific DNA recombinase
MRGMFYGYARVSTTAQDLATQIAQLEGAGCERSRIYHDKLSGMTKERPQLKKLLARVERGDTVIIPASDRLSRDAADLLTIARDLKDAGVVLAVLGVAATLEHKRLRERTTAGRAKAKDDGVKFGRKPKLTPHQQREAIKRRDAGEPPASIGRDYNVSRQTISRLQSQ